MISGTLQRTTTPSARFGPEGGGSLSLLGMVDWKRMLNLSHSACVHRQTVNSELRRRASGYFCADLGAHFKSADGKNSTTLAQLDGGENGQVPATRESICQVRAHRLGMSARRSNSGLVGIRVICLVVRKTRRCRRQQNISAASSTPQPAPRWCPRDCRALVHENSQAELGVSRSQKPKPIDLHSSPRTTRRTATSRPASRSERKPARAEPTLAPRVA